MGDRGGFDAAFRALYIRAYTVAFRILGDRAEAEDVAQETLARTLVAWRRVAECGYVEAWVARVAANVAVDTVRRRSRSDAALKAAFSALPLATHTDNGDDSVHRVVVADALARLPRRQREVLALRYFTDLSEADIALVLSISPGAVKRYAHRALSRLRTDQQLAPAQLTTPKVVHLAID